MLRDETPRIQRRLLAQLGHRGGIDDLPLTSESRADIGRDGRRLLVAQVTHLRHDAIELPAIHHGDALLPVENDANDVRSPRLDGSRTLKIGGDGIA